MDPGICPKCGKQVESEDLYVPLSGERTRRIIKTLVIGALVIAVLSGAYGVYREVTRYRTPPANDAGW
jgi:hypothetical protein